MRIIWWISGIVAAAVVTITSAAFALRSPAPQIAPEWSLCTGSPDTEWDRQITACTALIQSTRESRPNQSVAHYNRGNAYSAKGDRGLAIADYTETIRLDPQDASAYIRRGTTWHAMGNLNRAIADYDQAIKVDPRSAPAYSNRSNAWKAKGDLDRAISDYDQATRLDPKLPLAYDPYIPD
jgi:tetratricopeptide (TPR) repeat protein